MHGSKNCKSHSIMGIIVEPKSGNIGIAHHNKQVVDQR